MPEEHVRRQGPSYRQAYRSSQENTVEQSTLFADIRLGILSQSKSPFSLTLFYTHPFLDDMLCKRPTRIYGPANPRAGRHYQRKASTGMDKLTTRPIDDFKVRHNNTESDELARRVGSRRLHLNLAAVG